MRKPRPAFTIVELLIVIVVIGILTTIGFVGFSRYEADARDNQRRAQATIISEALEKYYDQNGEYPSCPAISGPSSSVIQNVLPGLEQNTLVAPKSVFTDNSIVCQDLSTATDGDYFAYVGGDTSPECVSGAACLVFTLKYKEESSGTIKTIESRRKASITGTPSITCATVTFSSISCSWNSIDGTNSYDVQYATNASFSANVGITSTPGYQTNISGLGYCTQYYIRIRAVSINNTSSWSPSISKTTSCLATPSCSVAANSFTQITASWGAVSGATSYTLEYDNNGDFSSLTGTYSGTALSSARTGLSYGTTYYFRVRASVSNGNSSWSPTCQVATLSIGTPTTSMSSVTNTAFTQSWNATANAATYRFQCSTNSSTWDGTCENTTTGTSFTYASNKTPGTTYYTRVRGENGSYAGPWSNIASATTTMSTPSCSATTNSTTQITVSCGAVAGATSYVYHLDGNSSFPNPSGYSSTSASRAFTGLTPGTTYYFRVYAQGADGNSSWSGTVNATTTISTPSCSATANSTTQITVSCGAIAGAVSYGYHISTDSAFTAPSGYSSTSASRAFTGLTPGTTYYFRVYAQGADGNSSWSGTTSATTTMSTPSCSATADSVTQITVSCGAIAGAVSYGYHISTDSAFTAPSGYSSTSASRAFTGLTPGTTYYFRVYAQGADGNSSWSATFSRATPNVVLANETACALPYSIRNTFYIRLELKETSSNPSNNTSTVTWGALRVGTDNIYNTYNQYNGNWHTIVINGEYIRNGSASRSNRFANWYPNNSYEALYTTSTENRDTKDSGTINVAHNADGSKTISASISDNFGTRVPGNASCTIDSYPLSDLR